MTTTRASSRTLAGVALAAGLGAAGYVAIANTTDGQVVGGGTPEVTFPATPTAAVAVVDDRRQPRLAGRAGGPSRRRRRGAGAGGTVVPVPISADSSGGFGAERTPLNETVALFGPETLDDEVPLLLGVGIDELLVVDEDELADWLAPVGAIEVDLPAPVSDAAGVQIAAAGPQTLSPDEIAAVLSAADPTVPGADRYPVDVAIWRAIADVVGDGLASPLASPVDTTAGQAARRRRARPRHVRADVRAAVAVDADRQPRPQPAGVDAVALDRPEVLVIFGHIAPSKVAAPNPGYNFRVVSSFSDDQLADGATRLDVAYTATEALLGVDANVISVDTSAGEAATPTVIEVSDESLAAAAATLSEVFGPVEVRVADTEDRRSRRRRHAGHRLPRPARHDRGGRHDGADRGGERGDDRLSDVSADPDSLQLAVTASRRADEKQGRNIVVLDVRSVLGITDYFVVVDAPNRRLVRTLVDDVEAGVREATGRSPLRVEGEREQQWVLDRLRRRRRPRVPRRGPPLLRDRAALSRRADDLRGAA